ncbi:MAG: hypothetical protein WA642_07520 [Steroidobacteraceae bacterium]
MSRQSTLRLLWAFSGATFIFGMTPKNMDAATSEPSPAQLMSQLNALQTRIVQLERGNNSRVEYPNAAPSADLATRVAGLSQQMANLTNAIKVNPNGVMITSQSISLNAQTSMSLQAGANMKVQSYGVTQISGAAQTSISGGMLILNKGGYPIVTLNSIKGGVGSPTVLAP